MNERYPIIFCGAGPGDPELITVKGMKALQTADVVLYAGSLVPEAVLTWAPEGVERISSATLDLHEIVSRMANAYEKGLKVVRLHTGDPSLYGAIREQMEALRARMIPYSVIPGVTAAFAAAATMCLEYTVPEVTQTLILTRMAGRTPVPEAEKLQSLARHGASMAIYLSMGQIETVAEVLSQAYGLDSPCAIAYRASQPEEKIIYTTARELAAAARADGIDRTAIILAGPALSDVSAIEPIRSKLYDRTFSHGYRTGK